MRGVLRAVLGIVLLVSFLTARVDAFPSSPDGWQEIKRRVLVLYKSSEGDRPDFNRAAGLLEQPLDSLGLVADYYDIDAGFPSEEAMSPYRGVVTFFNGPSMKNPEAYADWFAGQVRAGRRMVVFGDYGAFTDRGTDRFIAHKDVNRAFGALGLEYDGFWEERTGNLVLRSVDNEFMAFEEPVHEKELNEYILVRSRNPANRVFLSVARADMDDSDSALAVATPWGGYAFSPLMLYDYRQGDVAKQRWHLDPYKFLAEALGLGDEPRMDAASLNGRRLWMAQADGDGFTTSAPANRLASENILAVLKKYSLPVTASVITGELEDNPRARDVARAVFALPNAEPASHSETHPVDWLAEGVDLKKEITGSVEKIETDLLPEEKEVRVFAWTGWCNPGIEAMKTAQAAGLVTMNGLQTTNGFVNRFDALYPSRTYLSPLVRRVGDFIQLNHRAVNDYDLAREWKSPGEYRHIIETFQGTVRNPEIPVHVYFHWYSGADVASLAALDRVFRWSASQEISPVFVSDYADIVTDFRGARIWRSGPGRFIVRNNGHCRTVVFSSTTSAVDMERSRGVLGYAPRFGQLYVFLDEGREHEIVLTEEETSAPRVVSASGWLENWKVDGSRYSFDMRAYGPATVTLAGLNGYYTVSVRPEKRAKSVSYQRFTRKTEDGLLVLEFSAAGLSHMTVEPTGAVYAMAQVASVPLVAGFTSIYAFWFLWLAKKRRRGL